MAMVISMSLASQRQHLSKAIVRSTTHRRDSLSKPLAVPERLMDLDGPRVEIGQSLRQFFCGSAAGELTAQAVEWGR
ncbi:hypothetical protein [Mesorhizobium hawassense]|uniref:hypothetical protein n=1 Tax=Mesorhizobium hawassense TaxID=1209954 RepID=UPI001FE106D3|nr:hypothetical protein [Mesorhizobium hawassense]